MTRVFASGRVVFGSWSFGNLRRPKLKIAPGDECSSPGELFPEPKGALASGS